ncbi:MAG: helix-turn-helix transcriptional regulator [Clostridia bacterium]|nr:helix-turn-helix transcriptional regulator [Clostridia bacterium]
MKNLFSKNLQSLRLDKGLSQKKLATMIDVSQQCISEWENGNNEPTLTSLWKLSDVLEITIDELVGKSQI